MSKPYIKTAIYNIVTNGYAWRHLGFYEKDTPITERERSVIHQIMNKAKSSYICYTTQSGGYHVRGLSPLSTVTWAYLFKDLDIALKGNCSGHTLRVNRKPDEKQTLISYDYQFPTCDQITLMTCKQFGISPEIYNIEKWKSMFCIYNNGVAWGFMQRLPPMKRRKQSWQHRENA